MDLYKRILLSIVTVVLSSCGNKVVDQASIPTPDIGIDVQGQKYLSVTAPNGWNSFKTDDVISLMIQNLSDKQIRSDQVFGARIFVLTDNEWIEVKNKVTYSDVPIILEPTSENFDPTQISSVFILPDLPDTSISYFMRIFIVGNMIENDRELNKIVTYIDLKLIP